MFSFRASLWYDDLWRVVAIETSVKNRLFPFHLCRKEQALSVLIWDFDGTLGYRVGGMFSASLAESARMLDPHLDVTAEQIAPYLQTGFPWHTPERPHPEIASAEAWWEGLYPIFERALLRVGVAPDIAPTVAQRVRGVYTDPRRWRLYSDILPALRALAARGWCHVILSNHVPELPAIVAHLGLGECVQRVFCSARTGYEKPHARAFRAVMETMSGVDTFWMLGDSVRADIRGAEAVGLSAILVRQLRPDVEYCCTSLDQVEGIVGDPPSR